MTSGRPHEDDDGSDTQHRKCQDDRAALSAGFVDRRADGGLDSETEQATDRGHHSDFGLAPMLLGNQEHVEIRPQRAAHVGQQEVDGVERERAEPIALG
jgi:hypothetical protein